MGRAVREVGIELWPTACRFTEGHRVRVQIASAAFPRFARKTGTGGSPVGTLVERTSRLLLLVKLDKVDAETVSAALRQHVLTLPEHLRRSLTWDQGKEMGRHVQFTIDTGVQVYFCDPKSPWQRGSNENTNGLVRQYLPKRTDLKPYSQAELDAIALELNTRPRKTLEFVTPSEKFAEAVALTP